ARMGYYQGWGLGKAHQGLTCFPHQEENHGEGLGYFGSGKKKRPLRWTLHNHFIRPAGETTQGSELQAYPFNPRSMAIEEQKKKEAEEVYDLTKLFSEAGLKLEPESSVLAELLQELLGYHAMSPVDQEESFRAYTQLAAWDSLSPPTAEDEAADSPPSPATSADSRDSGPELSLLFSSGVEHCFAIEAREEGPACQESQSEADTEGPMPVPAEGDSEQGDDTSQSSESPLLIHLSPGTSDQIFRAWAQMAGLEVLSISSPSSSGSRSPFSPGLESPIPFEKRSFLSSHSSSSTPVNPASATPSLIESDIPSESEPPTSNGPVFSSLSGSESSAESRS